MVMCSKMMPPETGWADRKTDIKTRVNKEGMKVSFN